MKIIAPLLIAAATLGGCAVVPVGRPVVYGAPPMAVYPAAPPPVVVVPSRPYYGGYYGRRGHWR
jgi:hypothetical protein